MKKLFTLIILFAITGITSCRGGQNSAEYPTSPKEVAMTFLKLYNAGDSKAAEYVIFDGRYIMELALTAERAEHEALPEELAKMKQNPPAEITLVSERIDKDEFGTPAAFVECKVNDKNEYLTLYQDDGKWKVDITMKWADDWFDGQIY